MPEVFRHDLKVPARFCMGGDVLPTHCLEYLLQFVVPRQQSYLGTNCQRLMTVEAAERMTLEDRWAQLSGTKAAEESRNLQRP